MPEIHNTPRSAPQVLEDLNAYPPKKPSERVQMAATRSASLSAPDDISFLRLPGVKLVTGLSKSSLYALTVRTASPHPSRSGRAWSHGCAQRSSNGLLSESACGMRLRPLMPSPVLC